MDSRIFEEPANDGVRLFTIPETCKRLGCSRSTIYDLAANGLLTIRKLGGTNASRIRSDELDAYIFGLAATQVARRERRS